MQKNDNTPTRTAVTRFTLGQTFITPGAQEAIQIGGQTEIEFLRRHMSGDWEISATMTSPRMKCHSKRDFGCSAPIWMITEADRSATTILLPSEY
jgi:hypothetical protein